MSIEVLYQSGHHRLILNHDSKVEYQRDDLTSEKNWCETAPVGALMIYQECVEGMSKEIRKLRAQLEKNL
jgi:hypothetical protein